MNTNSNECETENSLDKDFNIISLHSAKGGVGKTSTAFMCAHSIIAKHNEENKNLEDEIDPYVFVFDLDFTGTEIVTDTKEKDKTDNTDNTNNKLHKDKIKYIKKEKEYLHYVPTSLTDIYFNYCESDDYFDSLCRSNDIFKDNDEYFQRANNIYYLLSGGMSNEFINKKWYLYEPFHVKSLIDFIYQLMIDFTKTVKKNHTDRNLQLGSSRKHKCYFVLDNSSGWSKLRDEIEYLLLLHSYEKVKFLFITSPDHQDMHATLYEMWVLYIKSLKTRYTIQKVYCASKNNVKNDPYKYHSLILDKKVEKLLLANKSDYQHLISSFNPSTYIFNFNFCSSILNKVFYDCAAPARSSFNSIAVDAYERIMKENEGVAAFIKSGHKTTDNEFVNNLLFNENLNHRIISPFSMELALIFSSGSHDKNKEQDTDRQNSNVTNNTSILSTSNSSDNDEKMPRRDFFEMERGIVDLLNNPNKKLVIYTNSIVDLTNIQYFSPFLRTLFSVCDICEKIIMLLTIKSGDKGNIKTRSFLDSVINTKSNNSLAIKTTELKYNTKERYFAFFTQCHLSVLADITSGKLEPDNNDSYFANGFEFIDRLTSIPSADQFYSSSSSLIEIKRIFTLCSEIFKEVISESGKSTSSYNKMQLSPRKQELLNYCFSVFFSVIFTNENLEVFKDIDLEEKTERERLSTIIRYLITSFYSIMIYSVEQDSNSKDGQKKFITLKDKLSVNNLKSTAINKYDLNNMIDDKDLNTIIEMNKTLYRSLNKISKKYNYIFDKLSKQIMDSKIVIPPTYFSYIRERIQELFAGQISDDIYKCNNPEIQGKIIAGHIKCEHCKHGHDITYGGDLEACIPQTSSQESQESQETQETHITDKDPEMSCDNISNKSFHCVRCEQCKYCDDYINVLYRYIIDMINNKNESPEDKQFNLEKLLGKIWDFDNRNGNTK